MWLPTQDPSWQELLRFCALRGAYRGAGSELMAAMLRADGTEGGLFGFANALTEQPQGDVSHTNFNSLWEHQGLTTGSVMLVIDGHSQWL